MNARWWARALVVAGLAVLPAGCGGDDDSTATDAGATTPTVTAPTIQPTVPLTTGTTGRPAPQTERARIQQCLTTAGYRLQGGAPGSTDGESPQYQIIFSGPRGGGYIGFYKNQSRALRVARQLRKNAKRTSGAAVERHGAINIVWVDLAAESARESVRSCLVT
jgi:hypothetical protein